MTLEQAKTTTLDYLRENGRITNSALKRLLGSSPELLEEVRE